MGLVVLTFMLVANSPLLDFRKISLSSQVARVESGEAEWEDFDFWYARNSLARPAYLKMESLKQEFADSDPELVALIEQPQNRAYTHPLRSTSDLWAQMQYRPGPFELPHELRGMIERWNIISSESLLIQVDLDDDGEFEYVLVFLLEDRIFNALFYYRENGKWQSGSIGRSWTGQALQDGAESIRTGEISTHPSRFKELHIGDQILRPIRNDR